MFEFDLFSSLFRLSTFLDLCFVVCFGWNYDRKGIGIWTNSQYPVKAAKSANKRMFMNKRNIICSSTTQDITLASDNNLLIWETFFCGSSLSLLLCERMNKNHLRQFDAIHIHPNDLTKSINIPRNILKTFAILFKM